MRKDNSLILLAGFAEETGQLLRAYLEQHYEIVSAADAQAALACLQAEEVDLLLCRHCPPQLDAIPLLHQARMSYPHVIRVLGGHVSEADMVAAINEAAIYQFFPERWSPEQIELLVRRALENRELAYRHRHLSRDLKFAENILRRHDTKLDIESGGRFDKLIYCSAKMARVCNQAKKAAVTDLPVLIQGETGTGKELMARGIHHHSLRREQPLLIQNCGGMSDELLLSELFGHKRGAFTGAVSDRLGLFPAADGGTVFLDEISDVSPAFQAALLRFLQEGEVKPLGSDKVIVCNVRIITASNRPLEAMVESGEFRRDLYYRLNGFRIDIPPLRERYDDIPVLAEFLARRYGDSINRRILGLEQSLQDKLAVYHWPGNVRELENEMRRLVALAENGTFLSDVQLSPHLARLKPLPKRCDECALIEGDTLKDKVEALEKHLLRDALLRHRWNQSRAAEELGLSRVGLANKIRRYELDQQMVQG